MLPLPFQAFAVSDAPLDAGLPRCALRGSLDPITGIFYKAPEHHARIRTLQACDKCRVRKAKCSGDHPVCERCRIRGLTCQYAPERRARKWIKPDSPDGGLDSRSSRYVAVAPSPHRHTADADHLYHEQARETEAVRLRRTTVPSSAETATLASSVPLEQPLPIAHYALDMQPIATKTSTSATSDDTPYIEEHTPALSFDPYSNNDSCATLFHPILSSLTDGDADHAALANHDPFYIDRGMTAACCPERRVPHPVLLHPPHQSGPGPGPPFPVDDQLPFSFPSGIDSPDRSHSACTSLTASPVLTRPSSRGLPTPINSHPNSPFALASLSPTHGPYTCDPHAYPLFSTEMIPKIDQGQRRTWSDDITWREIKDGAYAWEGNAFLDMDSVF